MDCKNNFGGHLASIHNTFDNLKLVDVAREYAALYGNLFYTGGNRLQGNWSWTDGSVFNFQDWAKNEPAIGDTKNCLAVDIAYGFWYAVNCFNTYVYVCQTPSSNYQSPTTTVAYPTYQPQTTTTGRPCSYQNSSCQTVDIVFIVDTSQSIDGNYFTQYVKQFIKDIGDSFHMLGDYPLGQTPSRVSVIEFASTANVTLPLVARTREDFNQRIDEYVYYDNQGITNISLGLQKALEVFQTASPPMTNPIAVLMTDGVSTLDLKLSQPAADRLKNYIYFLAGVGVNGINGNDVEANITNMATLIGNRKFAFGTINAANDQYSGLLAKALVAYPCTSSCKMFENKKQKKLFSQKLRSEQKLKTSKQ
uniref:COL6A n=1 Tax=Panagrolaimus sp. JU765 TaxID=591449 RepID=A0AC34R7Y1_9BILA